MTGNTASNLGGGIYVESLDKSQEYWGLDGLILVNNTDVNGPGNLACGVDAQELCERTCAPWPLQNTTVMCCADVGTASILGDDFVCYVTSEYWSSCGGHGTCAVVCDNEVECQCNSPYTNTGMQYTEHGPEPDTCVWEVWLICTVALCSFALLVAIIVPALILLWRLKIKPRKAEAAKLLN
ncbi:hypothetical protein Pelo_8548 [Pelomyxa schiedti]|nr:hypothetical protein Pelo_8548 [Pelomyxa schiedti]